MEKFVYKYVSGHVFQNGVFKNVWEQKEFASKRDLFDYLVTNKELIIEQKKAIEKHCEGNPSIINDGNGNISAILGYADVNKALYENDKEAGVLKRTILANTYWWMDSMSDVHLGKGAEGENGVFTETIKNRAAKIPPIDQHNWSLDGRIGKTLNIYEAPISWRALGVGRTGMTEGLFADAQIERSKNEARFNDYLNNEVDQHSVGMSYIDIQLAVNDPEEFPKESAVYNKYINKIGNRQAVEAQGFFFAVGKARLKEYSAVIAGANELTPVIGQPSGDTGKHEPSGDTQKKEKELAQAILKLSTTILT